LEGFARKKVWQLRPKFIEKTSDVGVIPSVTF